ncbi:biotin synthase [Prevotella bivia]|uniref:biotin synthase n=1 Tax=Prevotella bivia TaxID=28125 RepID=UPI00254B2DC5|nr:biotin synthase [Prevotella bivia]WIL18836.1 biotin synthase [Prevotella bivia]
MNFHLYNYYIVSNDSTVQACLTIAECSLSYAKIVPVNAIQACLIIAECSLSYAKIVPVNAIQACLIIAECSLSYAKVTIHYYILK